MSIRPVDFGGMIQRTDDVGVLKHQLDSRPAVEQQHVQTQMVKKTDEMRHQVMTSEHNRKADTHADAREKGKNEYFLRKKKSKKQKEEPDSVILKKTTGGSFDMKV